MSEAPQQTATRDSTDGLAEAGFVPLNWRKISVILSLLAAGIGASSFAGWVFDVDALKRIHPAWVTMKANTALCLILAGVAIALCREEKANGWRTLIAQGCAVVVAAVGALTLAEILGGWDFGIDQAFFRETQEQARQSFPGRMGPATALNFMLLGLGILTLDVRWRGGWSPAEFCTLGVTATTFLVFLAYFYQVELPHSLEYYLSIALHTVVAFLLLCAAMLLSRPDQGLITVFLADDVGGDIARRMLPAALLLPGLLGWACVIGRENNLYGRGVSTALLATLLTVIFAALVWWMARALGAADSNRRRADAARHQLAAIVDSSDDAIVSKDLNGVVRTWNAGAERLFGYTASEMIGQPIVRLLPPERENEEVDILRRLRAGERIEHYETIRMTSDGRRMNVSLTISPVRDSSGKIIGASKIARDITAQKQAEATLEQAKDQAEAANRAKDDFLAVLSHELRTPLTPALVAACDLESEPPDDPATLRRTLAIIRRNIELEARLVDDLLDVTRISHGKLRIHSGPVDLHATLDDSLAIAEPAFRKKEIAVAMELNARDHFVRGDAARLAQVFSNLLTNAAKFTPHGGRVNVRTTASDGQVQVEVSDSGIGIDAKLLPQIFEPFRQGELHTAQRSGGLGLGLSVAKGLVDAHGGTIEARSAGAGQGATFIVTLPSLPARAAATAIATGPSLLDEPRPLRVLLVEDHADTRFVLQRLMSRWGHEVTVAKSVAEAREAIANATFDLLLSDVGLADGTGLDVVAALREKSDIPAVAMSGYGMPADLARTREAGFTEHIVKPVSADALRESLLRFAGRKSATESVA